MTVKELKEILNNVERGSVRERANYDTLKKVSIEYGPDDCITIYFDFEPQED